MPDLAIGAKPTLFADGNVRVGQIQSCSLNMDGKWTPIETLDGISGFTPGAGTNMISFTVAILDSGPSFPFHSYVHAPDLLTLQFGVGPLALAQKYKILTAEFAGSTGNATTMAVTAQAGPADLE